MQARKKNSSYPKDRDNNMNTTAIEDRSGDIMSSAANTIIHNNIINEPRQSMIAPRRQKSKGKPFIRRSKSVDSRTRTSHSNLTSKNDTPSRMNMKNPNTCQAELYNYLGKTLTANIWYHGMMPRSDCEEILREEGDFLIRKTTVASLPTYCISVFHLEDVKHIPITYEKGQWLLKDVKRSTLAEMIDFFVREKKTIPPSNAILKKAMPRPEFYILHENITLVKKLGNGAFGEVYSGRLRLKKGEEIDVAVKMIKGEVNKGQLADFVREAKLMRRFDHPNIVRVYGVAPQEEPIMIVLELAQGGTLKSYCKKNNNCSEDQLLNFARDGARGMCYLAGRQVIHRDLAARNCLLGKNNEVKISDFGLSVADTKEIKLNKLKSVPIKWLSPETLSAGVFTKKTDVWSFGVLMWEIFSRCQSDPFPGLSNQQARSKILHSNPPLDPPYGCPTVVIHVMDMCFQRNADDRADFEKILKCLSPDENPPTKMEIFETYAM